MAKASGPGFESPATTRIFSHFFFAFFQTPLGEKVSIYFYEGSELDNCDVKAFLIQTPLGEKVSI